MVNETNLAYVYAGDDPVNGVDLNGEFPSCEPGRYVSSADLIVEGDQEVALAISEIKELRSEIKAQLQEDIADNEALGLFSNTGAPPPKKLLNTIKDSTEAFASLAFTQVKYVANVSYAAYNYFSGVNSTNALAESALQLRNIANAAIGTADELKTQIAADYADGVVAASTTQDAFNLEDLLLEVVTFD